MKIANDFFTAEHVKSELRFEFHEFWLIALSWITNLHGFNQFPRMIFSVQLSALRVSVVNPAGLPSQNSGIINQTYLISHDAGVYFFHQK